MDSLRGIPVEHKLETFSMPSTGTTSGHPKNWLCQFERNSALDNMEISQTLLQKPDTKLHGDFKHIPHKSNNTLPSQQPAKPFRLKHPTSLKHESCSTKNKPYSKLQIKTFVVVLLKQSFVIHLCVPKIYSVILKTAIHIIDSLLIAVHAFWMMNLIECWGPFLLCWFQWWTWKLFFFGMQFWGVLFLNTTSHSVLLQ